MRFVALAAMAAFTFSLYGWGSGFRQLFRMARGIAPATIIIGLAVVVFAGGILNLLSLAYPAALALVVAAGITLAVRAVLADPPHRGAWRADRLAVAVPVIAMLTFTVATQLPPAAYNYHDDFQKHFAFAVRMMETGTVAGSTLSAMGSETLGGMAWLHGFALVCLPLAYINVVDAVFGLLLCMLLAGWFASGRLVIASALCALAVVFINPQYVNTSALYVGAALMMSAIALTADNREAGPKPAALALLYAALIAIKPTFLLFAGCHLVLVAAMLGFHQRSPGKGARWATVCVLYSVGFLAPWILVHASNYWTAFTSPAEVIAATPPTENIDLFSSEPNNYGNTNLVYTIAVLVAMAATAWAALRTRRADDRIRLSGLMTVAGAAACLVCYVVLMMILAPKLSGAYTSLRYFAPFAIGVVPAVCGVVAVLMAETAAGRWARTAVPIVLCAVPLVLFADSFVARAEQAWDDGTILAFSGPSRSASYRGYNNTVLYGDMKQKVASLQAKVPEGETIVAWIGTPFYLDYARNPIIDANIAGLATPWAKLPSGGYFIWEYNGYATPILFSEDKDISRLGEREWLIEAHAARFARRIEQILQAGEPLYADEQFVIFRLPG